MNPSTEKRIQLPNLKDWFAEQGLEYLGTSGLDYEEQAQNFERWLSEKRQAGMQFMEHHKALRKKPGLLFEGAKSAIVFGWHYRQEDTAGRQLVDGKIVPKIAQYARLRDYHRVLKKRAQQIVEKLREWHGADFDYKIAVDSVPILERALASKTGRGFIGKNTCYIDSKKGSFLLLAEIITALDLQDPKQTDNSQDCGSCDKCQRACPTGALDEAYRLDANKCIAYWTIEHRGTLPKWVWPHLSTYLFGCDICQLVCPFNKTAEALNPVHTFKALKTKDVPSLFEIATMDQTYYEAHFGGTPMTRAKKQGLQRNALVAMHVLKDPKLQTALEWLSQKETHPVVGETLKQIHEVY